MAGLTERDAACRNAGGAASSTLGPRIQGSPPQLGDEWQVETDSGWKALEGPALDAMRDAEARGSLIAAFEQHSSCYLLDLETKTLLNTGTGHCRRLRRPPGVASPAPHAAAQRLPNPGTTEPPPASSVMPSKPAAVQPEVPPAKRHRINAAAGAGGRRAVAAAPAAAEEPKVAPGAGNALLAEVFEEMAAIQKLKRDRFRALAYSRAAATLRAHPEAVVSGAQAKAIAGIGAGMARRIDIVLATGELEELKELKRDSDVVALRELRSVHGIGAVRAGELVEKGVRSLADLRAGVASGSVHLDAVQSIGLRLVDDFARKIPRAEVAEHGALMLGVRDRKHRELRLQICGSYRRGKAECGDIDLLITRPDFTSTSRAANSGGALLKGFLQSLREAGYLTDDLAAGNTKYMGACRLPGPGRLHRRLDVRCLPADQFHFGTLYFTGSASLSIRLRMRAIELGMTLSEYGLERKDTGERIAANSEKEVFEALGMEYLEPHER
uniref:DNA polymerase n=1 Tax=Lingulaulax polyedra TaxID=160621 RepID=A0A516AGF6_LINPO|nr:DNA polymerase beta [Lingulodinium polyedra]